MKHNTCMKKIFLGTMAMLILVSCSTTSKFPVSSITPAADIIAKKKKDKNNNYSILVIANNLASVDRLDPPKSTYVVWIEDKNKVPINIGQLKNKNVKKLVLKTVTSFDAVEIFITAEDQGDIRHPTGIEISRTTFKR